MNTARRRTWAALALQGCALAALGLALAGRAWLDPQARPRLLVLVDRSQSMPREASEQALAEVARGAQAAGAELQWLEFAGRPAAPGPRSNQPAAALDPAATNVEAALDVALAAHAQSPLAGVVVVSDGLENHGRAERALRSLQAARLPLQWLALGRPAPPTRIAQVLAPARVTVGQPVALAVQLAGQLQPPLRVQARMRSAGGEVQTQAATADAGGRATLMLPARDPGAAIVELALQDPASGQTLTTLADAAVVDVLPRAAILYAQGSEGVLAASLQRGGWPLVRVPAARLDAQADALAAYRAVVLDDVAVSDASPRFWQALADAVQQRGLGLLVLGGERAFARGGYAGSVLESVLPLLSQPPALDESASVVFAVDKSGSMGQGSGGVDRFRLAQRAVLETARGLGERDALGLLVFDVEPQWLLPLGPAAAGTAALARDWRTSPGGGTRIAPALDAAIAQLEQAAPGRRLLVLVSDGFVDDAPLAGLRARLQRAHIETVALAVGPDADVAAMQRLFDGENGLVLRVAEAAELPLVMRSGLERRRARVERGRIEVRQALPLPFAPGLLPGWPAIAAHAVTRPQAQAVVVLQTLRGEPLLAYRQAGAGRVLALASGLGRWTPQWLGWREWPRLAGGLAEGVAGTSAGAVPSMTVTELADGLQLDVDAVPGAAQDLRIAVDTPRARGRVLAVDAVAPGRQRASAPDDGPGLYTFVVTTAQGTQRQLHLRHEAAEDEAYGTQPLLPAWQAAGLIAPWNPARLAGGKAPPHPPDRSLLALALALFLAAVLVDRLRVDVAAIGRRLHALRRRSTA